MKRTIPRGLSITSLQLAFGMFTTVIGTLVLVAPYHFSGPAFISLQATLPVWGVTFLVAGASLVCAAAMALRQQLLCAAHLLAGGALLIVALVSGFSGNWAGVPLFTVSGLGVAVAPYLAAGRRGPSRQLDLLTILLGLSTAISGLFMLVTQGQFSLSIYDPIRPYLSVYGIAFLVGGFALFAVHMRPGRSPWPERIAHLAVAVVFFAWLIGVPLPSSNWVGVAYYGGFGTLALFLPWLGPRLSNLDGASLRAQLALVLAAAAAVPFLVLAPMYAQQQEDRAVTEQLNRQEALVTALAQKVADYINLHQAVVKVLAGQPGLIALTPSQQQAVLQNVSAVYPDANGFSTVAADGASIARVDDRAPISWVGDPTFEDARQTNQPFLGIVRSPSSNRPMVSLGVPILDAEGDFAGMVSSSLEFSRIATLLEQADFGDGALVDLVDSSGHVVAHPDADHVTSFDDVSSNPSVVAFLNDPAPSGSVRKAGPRGALQVSFARVSGLGWGVVVERPTSSVLAPTRAQLDLLFLGLLVMIAAAASFGMLGAGWLSRSSGYPRRGCGPTRRW